MSDPAVSGNDLCPSCGETLRCESQARRGIGSGSAPSYRYWCPRCSETAKELNLSGVLEFHGVVRAGDVLVVECERRLSPQQFAAISKLVEDVFSKFGVGIIVLDGGLRVAGTKPAPSLFAGHT